MAGRFQRLDNNSEDITASPEFVADARFYDEPQDVDFTNLRHNTQSPPIYTSQDHRRMTYTTRKPVGTIPQSQSRSHSQSQTLSQATTPEQPLITNYFDAPRHDGSYSSNDNPFSDPERKRKTSYLSKTASSLWSKARGPRGPRVSHASTPLFAAPWRHEPYADSSGTRSSTSRYFNRKKQQNRIFFHFFLQWLVPLAFCGALFGTLYFYSSKQQLSRKQKYMFNSLMTGFSLCLGFAVVNGMKEYANIFRWRLLSSRYWSLQQFELLLGIASQKKATRFLWVGRTEGSILPNTTQVLVLFYVVIMLGIQIVIALLGLCYSVDDAGTSNFEKGNVSIADLSFIRQADNVDGQDIDPYLLQTGSVNSYGISAQRYNVYYLGDTSQTTSTGHYYGRDLYTDNSTSWWYYFADQNADPNKTQSAYTDRWVEAKAECIQHTITAGGWGESYNVTYIAANGRTSYLDYLDSETVDTTTYYANQAASCGPRCTNIWVLNVGLNDGENIYRPQLFNCNNTMSAVTNAPSLQSNAYQLPDMQARLFAGAIGYDGSDYTGRTDINIPTYQPHTYDTSSLWSWTRMNGVDWKPTDVANLVMRFSIGAVAAMDDEGPRKYLQGQTPVAAQQVNIHWMWAIVVLVVVPGIQFSMLIITTIWGNQSVVRDDSFLASANLLRPMIERLEKSGCALTSDEICEVLQNPKIAYGVRMPEGASAYGGMAKGNDELMHLDVVTEEEASLANEFSWRVGMTMPQGPYNGVKLA